MPGTVLVIGAGIAGLAAARDLQAAGQTVMVLEARNRIGGRIWTDRSWPDLPADLGANWIHGIKQNPIAELARQIKARTIATDDESYPYSYAPDGEPLSEGDCERIEDRYERLLKEVRRARRGLAGDRSLGGAIDEVLARWRLAGRDLLELRHQVNSEIEQEYAADADNLSLLHWDDYDRYGGVDVILPEGYDRVVRPVAQGLDIRLSHVVTQISYDRRAVRVATARGAFEAERVLVTVPLGVLQRAAIAFEPALPPRKQAAIRQLGMGVLNKVIARFPNQFWPQDSDWLEYISPRPQEWAEYLNYAKYSQTPTLLAFNAGSFGRQVERLTDEETLAQMLGVLRTIWDRRVPNPVGYRITRWASDPFAGGSYSYLPPGASRETMAALAEPVGERLFFAGEATQPGQYGTVHGAYRSGGRAAQELLRS